MERYRLPYVIHNPSAETGGVYMAEIPALPGCRAWAATLGDVMDCLESVAEEYISSCLEHGDALPPDIINYCPPP